MTNNDLDIYKMTFENKGFWKEMKSYDISHIEFRIKTAESIIQKLLSIDPSDFKGKSRLYRMELLRTCYQGLCFFGTKTVKQKFRQLGMNEIFLAQFVDLDMIIEEFDLIERSTNTRILRIAALAYIQMILKAKIWAEMLQWARYVEIIGGKEKPTLLRRFENLYRQREYQKEHGARALDEFDRIMLAQLDMIGKNVGDESIAKKIMKQTLSGKTVNYYLRIFFEDCFLHNDNVIPEYFYADCFNLVKTVTNHPRMYALSDYEELKDGKYYGRSYRWYQNHIVKKVIYQR